MHSHHLKFWVLKTAYKMGRRKHYYHLVNEKIRFKSFNDIPQTSELVTITECACFRVSNSNLLVSELSTYSLIISHWLISQKTHLQIPKSIFKSFEY